MTEGWTLLFSGVAAVAAMLAVLLSVIMLQGKSLRREIDTLSGRVEGLAGEVTALNGRVDALTGEVNALTGRVDALSGRVDVLTVRVDAVAVRVEGVSERVARIEGALTGPWRPPANGNPAPAPTGVEANV